MKWNGLAVKVVVAIVFFLLCYFLVDIESVILLIFQSDKPYLIAATSVVFCIRLLMALRWKLVLNSLSMPLRLSESCYVILVSGAFGFFSPGGILADIYKGDYIYNKEKCLSTIATVVMFDKIIGIFSMFLLAWMFSGLFLFTQDYSAAPTIKTICFLSGMIILACISFGYLLTKHQSKAIDLTTRYFKKAKNPLSKIASTLNTMTSNKNLLTKVLVLSLSMQVLRSITFYFILLSLSIHISIINVIALFPIVFMLMLIPITFSGLGVREGATFLLFKEFGLTLEQSIGSGLVFYAIQLIIALIGVVVYFIFPNPNTRTEKI